MDETVTIRLAGRDEVSTLPRMQAEAGRRFREIGMERVADGGVPDVATFARARREGCLLVAVGPDGIVGFVQLEVLDSALHVEQVTVAPAHGRQGIGTRLMRAARQLALERGYARMTLTAFRDVPFNGPFYESLGWRALPAERLTPGLAAVRQAEAEAGIDVWPRQAMVLDL
jgi:GNAT superfamily N-acetyltransferase